MRVKMLPLFLIIELKVLVTAVFISRSGKLCSRIL